MSSNTYKGSESRAGYASKGDSSATDIVEDVLEGAAAVIKLRMLSAAKDVAIEAACWLTALFVSTA